MPPYPYEYRKEEKDLFFFVPILLSEKGGVQKKDYFVPDSHF